MTPRPICICGPTASGKSELALRLCETLGGELISVDAVQVFRDMDIGSAKPDADERARAPHHLIDIVDPGDDYSAAVFARDARRVIGEVLARGRWPILAGGTMFYFSALWQGLDRMPTVPDDVRQHIRQRLDSDGLPALYAELQRVDPQLAQRLEPGDSQRILRALEVWHASGQPLSDFHRQQPRDATDLPIRFALVPADRRVLHRRIAERFQLMLDAGLVEEVRDLIDRYPTNNHSPAWRAVGYRQVIEYLRGRCDAVAMTERSVAATRQLAKRQLTWIRHTPGLVWWTAGDSSGATGDLLSPVLRYLGTNDRR